MHPVAAGQSLLMPPEAGYEWLLWLRSMGGRKGGMEGHPALAAGADLEAAAAAAGVGLEVAARALQVRAYESRLAHRRRSPMSLYDPREDVGKPESPGGQLHALRHPHIGMKSLTETRSPGVYVHALRRPYTSRKPLPDLPIHLKL